MVAKNWNHLSILTKAEIIEYLNSQYWYKAPSRDNIRFFKWNKLMEAHQAKMDKHCDNDKPGQWAKKADELAVKFNNETDSAKKLKYLSKRQIYIDKIMNHNKEFDELQKEYDEIERKYGRKIKGE